MTGRLDFLPATPGQEVGTTSHWRECSPFVGWCSWVRGIVSDRDIAQAE
jgi:hypothetical protein